jgi:hypothetical protein
MAGYTMLPQEDDGMNGYGGKGLSYYTGSTTSIPSSYYGYGGNGLSYYTGSTTSIPSSYYNTGQTATPWEGDEMYAGYGYDSDQNAKKMAAESAADADLKRAIKFKLAGKTYGGGSYGTPAQYAASQPMALQINSLPKLSLTTPQYKQWNSAEEQSEVYKAASPMIRENRRRMDALMASLSGLDPTMRRLQQKDIMQGYGDALSKTFGTANQIGGQRYINKLNYDNQQAAQNAQIANQQAIADHTQKMSAIEYNLKLGQQGQRLPKYIYTDYS